MTKFIVDPETLGYVSNGLGDLHRVLAELPGMTEGAGAAPFGGQMVLDALERFDADWSVGREVIGGEIASLQDRLGDAMRAYTLIEDKVREGAAGVVDIGKLGFGVIPVSHREQPLEHARHGEAGAPTTSASTTSTPTATAPTTGAPPAGAASTTTTAPAGAAPTAAGAPGSAPGPSGNGGAPGHGAGHAAATGSGVTIIGGGEHVTVRSPLLTSGQERFVGELAGITGLSPRVLAAWCLAEKSGPAAHALQSRDDNNWLNVDAGAAHGAWRDPSAAARRTARFLEGALDGGSSQPIQHILLAGNTPEAQIDAIARSGWETGGYDHGALLHRTYAELSGMTVQKSS